MRYNAPASREDKRGWMTSEEIKNLKRGFGDALGESQEQFAIRAIDGIWEIAYQLAVMNEREIDNMACTVMSPHQ